MITLSTHRVYAFLTFAAPFKAGLAPPLSGLIDAPPGPTVENSNAEAGQDLDRPSPSRPDVWVPERLRPAIHDRYRDEPILKACEQSVGGNYYVPLQRLVSGKLPARCKVYRLTERAQGILRKGELYLKDVPAEERFLHSLAMTLTPKSAKRLHDQLHAGTDIPGTLFIEAPSGAGRKERRLTLPVRVAEFVAYHFATGRVVCQVGLEAVLPNGFPMTDVLLAELTDHVGRFAALGWIETPVKPDGAETGAPPQRLIEMEGFTIGTLVARLLFGAGGFSQRSFRTFTHAYAQVAADQPATTAKEIDQLANRLARQYTSDYALTTDLAVAQKVADFDNVQHVLTREGGATVVDPRVDGEAVGFLERFLTEALLPSYLPIAALNLHQHAQLLDLSARSILATADPEDIDDLIDGRDEHGPVLESVDRAWRDMQEALALLRVRFRFVQISPVTMHNAFNTALRTCFGVDELEAVLSRDLAEISARVQAIIARDSRARDERLERRYGWIPAVAAAFAAGVLALEFVSTFHAFNDDNDVSQTEWLSLIPVVVFMGVAFAFGIIQRRK